MRLRIGGPHYAADMPSAPDSSRLAVLIDGDNTTPTIIEALLAEIAKYGSATVKRAYGDWTTPNLRGWKEAINAHAIQPMQQFAYTTGKNATDSAMIIDAMDLLYTGNLDGFCLVSSDSDFTKLASRLREAGKTVYGFGEPQTPQSLVAACDKFVYLDVLRRADKPKEPSEGETPSARTGPQEHQRAARGRQAGALVARGHRRGLRRRRLGQSRRSRLLRRQAGARLRLPQLGLRQAGRPGVGDRPLRGERSPGKESGCGRSPRAARPRRPQSGLWPRRGRPPSPEVESRPGIVGRRESPHPTYEQLADLPAYAEQPVPIAFEDVNGHLNVRHYTGIASEGLDESLVAQGIPQNWPATGTRASPPSTT